jgi:hypothetical protein
LNSQLTGSGRTGVATARSGNDTWSGGGTAVFPLGISIGNAVGQTAGIVPRSWNTVCKGFRINDKALRKDQYYERIKLLRILRCFFFATFSHFAQKNKPLRRQGLDGEKNRTPY